MAEDKLPPETPSSVAAFSDKENSVRDNAELVEQPSSLDSPLLIQTEQHTTHTRKTTTTTIEDTALSLHVRAPFQGEPLTIHRVADYQSHCWDMASASDTFAFNTTTSQILLHQPLHASYAP